MFFNAKESRLDLGEVQLDCITFGRGKKPLIMIQGLNTRGIRGASAMLAVLYRRFAKEYAVYMFDRRKNIRGDITVREMASDVASAMDALGIRDALVIGVSQGGMIAQYLAIDRPDLVSKLVLSVTVARNNSTVEAVVSDWIEYASRGDFKKLVTDMTLKMYSDAYVRRYRFMLPLLTLVQKPRDPQRFITLARACLTCDAYGELDRIKCPVFVIGGRQDRIVTGEASAEIAEKLGCRLHIYENLGHATYEEAKDFNERILAFLKE